MTEISAGKKRYVKRVLADENPTVQIGKAGVSDQITRQIGNQLEKKKMIKVKILQTALGNSDAKEIAEKVAEETKSVLVEVKGHTFMLYKKK